MYIPLPQDTVEIHVPVPFSIWDPDGVLLLRKGEVIESVQHLDNLFEHSPRVRANDYQVWRHRHAAGRLRAQMERSMLQSLHPVMVWPDLHASLTTLLHQNTQVHDFATRLHQVESIALHTIESHVDDSLFVLVQQLFDRQVQYSATHALLCAVVCRLVGEAVALPPAELSSLFRAALTMNIGMARLHDELSRQDCPLTEVQKHDVRIHPLEGVDRLRQLGVGDRMWLQLVQDHHELTSGQGYPEGKRELSEAAQLLHLADVFVARISPRRSRSGLLPSRAARDIYLGDDGHPAPLGAAFVKTLGMYIPGSYVRLATDEVAVVVHRGRRVNEPVVFAIVSHQGMPLVEPSLRDTADSRYEIKGSVSADDVKVRVNPRRLLTRA